ncbi:PhoX family protein [Bordetella avium]|uniref:Exported protein n=1 Tax=Bordetella avium (strain 197N) TaxID=360910 RepID=Q2KX41_BORA1|nr:PhoX family phosphatase [Bordetella avium]CAJ48323.1 putative exported protein [Bordetella avium 197N]
MSKSITDKIVRNPSGNRPFSDILERNLSRRAVMRGSLVALAGMSTLGLAACGGSDDEDDAATPAKPQAALKLGFQSLPASMTHACVVPAGYVAYVLGAWGTPLNDNAQPWDKDGNNSSNDLLNSTGMHHDGMHYFPLEGSSNEGLLVVNHEYIDQAALHPNGPTVLAGKRPVEEVRKEINAHGVAVMHIRRQGGKWSIVPNSRFNRRFTSATPMKLSGPVAGTDWVKTPYSPNGSTVRGTNNNCGNGTTPWGTYITAEENWAACFVNTAPRPPHQVRVGVATARGRYQWETAANDPSEQQGEFARFDVTPTGADATQDWRNEVNGFGYLVEIDPYDPASIATKRTAMGRFAHEGCTYSKLEAGKPIAFYTGDDSQFEYLYRFVSEAVWDPKDAQRSDRLTVGAKYLDRGTLYVARFDADGSGVWLPLTPETVGLDGVRTLGQEFGALENILINTRAAADFVGATPMDRPEWTATHPSNGDIYLSLTNNTARNASKGTNPANPRLNNVNGHIVRWHDEPGSTQFKWDIFLFGSSAGADADTNRSGLTALNELASPDGLAFDDRGILWIQTDNGIDNGRKNDVARTVNDQMLAVIPGSLAHSSGSGPAINAANQADLRRFFVGPDEAEITGFAFTPDYTAIFLNVQHPVNWPAYGTDDATQTPTGRVRPRSSTVVIQRADGGQVGV